MKFARCRDLSNIIKRYQRRVLLCTRWRNIKYFRSKTAIFICYRGTMTRSNLSVLSLHSLVNSPSVGRFHLRGKYLFQLFATNWFFQKPILFYASSHQLSAKLPHYRIYKTFPTYATSVRKKLRVSATDVSLKSSFPHVDRARKAHGEILRGFLSDISIDEYCTNIWMYGCKEWESESESEREKEREEREGACW